MDTDSLDHDLISLSATDVVGLLARGDVSPAELVAVSRRRIEAVDGTVNALPTRCFERALEKAEALARAGDGGPLRGLPVAVKDLNAVAGVRTTYGSTVFADHVPETSDYTVATLERNGGLIVAKSNTPEFGAGGTTFNDVFGVTVNPWNGGKTSGGSSGGSAAAVASGQVWAAQGSDFGGSLRIPASFCGVVGLRPTPGVVPRGPASQPFSSLWVDGPIARNVADCALMLDALAGRDGRDPLSRERTGGPFLDAAKHEPDTRLRIGVSADLGLTPVDPGVAKVFAAAVARIGDTGAEAADAYPDFSGAPETFHALRSAWLAADMAELLKEHENKLKPELVWNIKQGMALTADDIGRAEVERGRLFRRVMEFFSDYDLLITPATVIPPFDKDQRFPDEIAGQALETYLDWYKITYCVSLIHCPAMSLPIGYTEDGLPVGAQIIAPPFAEARLFRWAATLESVLGLASGLPIDPRSDS